MGGVGAGVSAPLTIFVHYAAVGSRTPMPSDKADPLSIASRPAGLFLRRGETKKSAGRDAPTTVRLMAERLYRRHGEADKRFAEILGHRIWPRPSDAKVLDPPSPRLRSCGAINSRPDRRRTFAAQSSSLVDKADVGCLGPLLTFLVRVVQPY